MYQGPGLCSIDFTNKQKMIPVISETGFISAAVTMFLYL